jgi:putative peptidoglycan lipid II flippase
MRRILDTFLPRGAVLLSVLTFGGYLMGLLRDRTFARTFGAGPELDAYNAALVLPELALDVLVVAGLTAAFVPVYVSARDRDTTQADRFSRAVLTMSILIMAITTVILFIFAPETVQFVAPGFTPAQQVLYVELFRIMCVTAVIFAASFALGEMLVAHQRFLSYGLAPLLYNAGIVGGTLLLAPRIGIYGAAIGTVIGALLHLSIRLVESRRIRLPLRLRLDVMTSEFRAFVLLALPKTISQPVEPLTFLYFTSLASTLVAGSVSSLSFARNFQSVPVSLIGVAFSVAAFPVLSRVAASGDRSQFVRLTLSNLATILVITSVGAVVVYGVSTRVVDTFLGGGSFDAEDVRRTGAVLAAFSLSIPLESGVQLLARAFYATHNTVLPVAASILGLVITVAVAQLLLPAEGIVALPLAFTAGQAAKLGLLGITFPLRVRAVGRGAATLPPEPGPPGAPPPGSSTPITGSGEALSASPG